MKLCDSCKQLKLAGKVLFDKDCECEQLID